METHASKEVEDERLKLQQDIQRIQDTLYDDSYSEYDSDSDSECLEIDLEQRNHTDDDTRTRSSIGESSISHFGGTEVSDGTDFEPEIYVGDSEATELPITTGSSLALNRAYQEVIVDVLQQIEESLQENRQRQEDAEKNLVGQREKNLTAAQFKVYYRQYAMPYIKDPNGGVPPANEDVMLKKLLKEHKQDILPEREWLIRDRKKMYDAITEDALQQLLQPLMNRLELEQEKLEKCPKKEEAVINARITALEEDIANKRNTSRGDLLKNVDAEKTDWLKISNIAYDGRKSWQECQMMWMNVLNPAVNRGKWGPTEDEKLIGLVKKFKGKNWVKIAEMLKTSRTAYQCLQRYQMHLNPENTNRPWTAEEDKKLLQVVSDIKNTGHRLIWAKVSSYMESRSGNMCFNRFHVIDPDLKRGQWTKDEDIALFGAVKMCGTKSWTRIAEFVQGRSSLQCRDRWSNSLDPSIKMGNWSYEEDKKLLMTARELGKKSWTKIAAQLPGRTDNMVLQRLKRLENWERKTKWFEELPEVTKRALLGSHLSPEELKAKENMTWQNFQKELCVHRDDYRKQEQDRKRGELVVPRPPPLLGYCTMVPKRVIESRIHLQDIIMKHVRSIQGHDDTDTPSLDDPKTQQELAVKVQFADANNISVKKLLELSRDMKNRLGDLDKHRVRRPTKALLTRKTFNFDAMRRHRRMEGMLRSAVQSIFKKGRRRKKGRPRKFFNRTLMGNNNDDEIHNIKVKSLNLIMKALDINARKMLNSATKYKETTSSTLSTESASASTTSSPSVMKSCANANQSENEEELEEQQVGDVGMLRSVSQKETESSDLGQEGTEDITGFEKEQWTQSGDSGNVTKSDMRKSGDVTENGSIKESFKEGVSQTSQTCNGPLETPKKKTVTFGESTNNVETTDKSSSPNLGTKSVVKGVLRQTTSNPVAHSASTSTSTSTSVSTSTSTSRSLTQTEVISLSDSESSDDEGQDSKSLPLLPPNVTNMRAFKTLLLSRKKNVSNAGMMYNPTFYHLMPSKNKPKPTQLTTDASAVNRKRGRESDQTDAPPVKKASAATNCEVEQVPTMTRAQLKAIHKSEDYKLLKSRFQALFVWPALMSTIHPPFDRKDFSEKANYVTAGEEEVSHMPRSKTKGYPMSRGHRYYQKMVKPRAEKEEKLRRKQGGESAGPAVTHTETSTDVGTSGPVDLTVGDDGVPAADEVSTDPPVKRRGRPRGKTKPYIIEKPARSMRERKEKIAPDKKTRREVKGLRVAKKRALLAPDLRQAMLESVAAMKDGILPDPAKHVFEPHSAQAQPQIAEINTTVVGSELNTTEPEESTPKTKGSSPSKKVKRLPVKINDVMTTVETKPSSASTTTNTCTSTLTLASNAVTLTTAESSGVPMILTYMSGGDGSVVPVLNPVPVKVLPKPSEPQLKMEVSETVSVSEAGATQSEKIVSGTSTAS